jgi:hypothetical protein
LDCDDETDDEEEEGGAMPPAAATALTVLGANKDDVRRVTSERARTGEGSLTNNSQPAVGADCTAEAVRSSHGDRRADGSHAAVEVEHSEPAAEAADMHATSIDISPLTGPAISKQRASARHGMIDDARSDDPGRGTASRQPIVVRSLTSALEAAGGAAPTGHDASMASNHVAEVSALSIAELELDHTASKARLRAYERDYMAQHGHKPRLPVEWGEMWSEVRGCSEGDTLGGWCKACAGEHARVGSRATRLV